MVKLQIIDVPSDSSVKEVQNRFNEAIAIELAKLSARLDTIEVTLGIKPIPSTP